ncbi:MAG: hypothetical protein D6742_06505 [Cyanobacteria bacterium J069]|nr:MAG: hypothetical protein D6742_06505 [Cyanobacteria bacterium J069]
MLSHKRRIYYFGCHYCAGEL